jgi:hypothetical protein
MHIWTLKGSKVHVHWGSATFLTPGWSARNEELERVTLLAYALGNLKGLSKLDSPFNIYNLFEKEKTTLKICTIEKIAVAE